MKGVLLEIRNITFQLDIEKHGGEMMLITVLVKIITIWKELKKGKVSKEKYVEVKSKARKVCYQAKCEREK